MSLKEGESGSSCSTENDFKVATPKTVRGKRHFSYHHGEKLSRTLSEDGSLHLGESSHFSDYSSISWSTPMLDKEVPLDVLFSAFVDSHQRQLKYIEKTGWDESTKLKEKVRVLESYVAQLEEQNDVLINTATELERETRKRISLMESRLRKSAKATKEVVLHLHEYEEHFRDMVIEKTQMESAMEDLTQQRSTLKVENGFLRDQNANLRHDLHALLHITHQARSTGHWELDCVTFCELTPDQVFGPVRSFSRTHSGESLAEYSQAPTEEIRSRLGILRRGSLMTSSCGSLSNSQDDLVPPPPLSSSSQKPDGQLRKEVRYLQRLREQAQLELLEKDRIIANLETQITTLNYELTIQKAECDRHTLDLALTHATQPRMDTASPKSPPPGLCHNHNHNDSEWAIKSVGKILPDQCNGHSSSSRELVDASEEEDSIKAMKLSRDVCTQADLTENLLPTMTRHVPTREKYHQTTSAQTETKSIDVNVQTEDVKKDIKEIVESSVEKISKSDFEQLKEQLRRAEDNALAKDVLVGQLQTHLETSAKEVELKDTALKNVETKLEISRQTSNRFKEKIVELEREILDSKEELAELAKREANMRLNIEAREEIIKEIKVQEQSLQEQKRVLMIQVDEQAEQLMSLDEELRLAKNKLDLYEAEVELQKVTIRNLREALVRSKQVKLDQQQQQQSNVPNYNIARRAVSQSSIYDV